MRLRYFPPSWVVWQLSQKCVEPQQNLRRHNYKLQLQLEEKNNKFYTLSREVEGTKNKTKSKRRPTSWLSSSRTGT